MPAIWFRYEVSPITVKYTHKKKPLYHFLTTFCAIIGGTFTVAGMIDSMIFSAHNMVKKAQEGKLSWIKNKTIYAKLNLLFEQSKSSAF